MVRCVDYGKAFPHVISPEEGKGANCVFVHPAQESGSRPHLTCVMFSYLACYPPGHEETQVPGVRLTEQVMEIPECTRELHYGLRDGAWSDVWTAVASL
jgi:hypothetical protein